MFERLIKRLRGVDEGPPREWLFDPLYTVEQLGTISNWPIISVLPFAAPGAESSIRMLPGPGMGIILANLLRRNLLLTRQVSVVELGDLMRTAPEGATADWDFDSLSHGECDVLIHGAIYPHNTTEGVLELRVLRPEQPPVAPLRLKFPYDRVSELGAFAAKRLAALLSLRITPEITAIWRQGQPQDWPSLCRAAACVERNDMLKLVELVDTEQAHADAITVACGSDSIEVEHQSLLMAARRDKVNPNLLRSLFFKTWKSNGEFEPEAMKLLVQSLRFGPGDGKSQMCLPHVIPKIPANIPFVLAHSHCGYRLLRTNAFALHNFSLYLMQYSPEDSRIPALFIEAMELDPAAPGPCLAAIEYLNSRGRTAEALRFAQLLVQLCTPPMHPRTLYWFGENPVNKRAMETGEFDPLKHALSKVAECKALLDQD